MCSGPESPPCKSRLIPTASPEADRHFNMQVYFHKLGSDWKSDTLALGTKDGLERVSEVFLDNRYAAPAFWLPCSAAMAANGRFMCSATARRRFRSRHTKTASSMPRIGPDDAIYGISRAGAPNGKIVKLKRPMRAPRLPHAPVIVPEGDVAILSGGAEQHVQDLSLSPNRLFVRDIVGGPNQVRMFDLDGKPEGNLPLPDVAANAEIEPLANGDVLFDVSTYLRPRYYAQLESGDGQDRGNSAESHLADLVRRCRGDARTSQRRRTARKCRSISSRRRARSATATIRHCFTAMAATASA